MAIELKTIGHATLVVLEDGKPLVATDPWLTGPAYWCSWWLERYPTAEEVDLVKRAEHIYLTHSHPDHFHYRSLKLIGPRPILHPQFPRYSLAEFLEGDGFPGRVLEPWQWYELSARVRIASIPVPVDDSVLVIDTPGAVVVNMNDAYPQQRMLEAIRNRMCSGEKPVVVLKSYAPASSAIATFKNGERAPLKSRKDYVLAPQRMAERLGASMYVPFASQAFFNRTDSRWANEFKVTHEDLSEHWGDSKVQLCEPFVTMNLDTLEYTSSYSEVDRTLGEAELAEVREREEREAAFQLPEDTDEKLKRYMDEVYFLRLFFRHGIGWRFTSSGSERYYDCRTREISHAIPANCDFVVSLPDMVFYESLQNNVLTDLGITMFIRVETRTSLYLTLAAFSLMGLHDYGHFNDKKSFLRFLRFYFPCAIPSLLPKPNGVRALPPSVSVA